MILAGAAVAWYLFNNAKAVGYLESSIEGADQSGKTYVGTYKVVKIFRVSNRRETIRSGLTRDEAISLVNSYPDSDRSMVVFMKQFTADKYYI